MKLGRGTNKFKFEESNASMKLVFLLEHYFACVSHLRSLPIALNELQILFIDYNLKTYTNFNWTEISSSQYVHLYFHVILKHQNVFWKGPTWNRIKNLINIIAVSCMAMARDAFIRSRNIYQIFNLHFLRLIKLIQYRIKSITTAFQRFSSYEVLVSVG